MGDQGLQQPYLIQKGTFLGGGVSGIVELLPDGNVVKSPWPGEMATDSQKDIRIEAHAYQRIAERYPGHSRFVKLVEFDQEQHTLTMQYMAKGTLRVYLQENNQHITRHQRHLWIKAMTEGLTLLHSAAIVHCDLTPHNLLLDDKLELKVADFGCCSIDQSASTGGANARFYPPRADWRTPACFEDDLFALGSCMYEVLTGAPPLKDMPSSRAQTLIGLRQMPDLAGLDFRHIIRDCWLLRAESAENVYNTVLQSLQSDSP